MARRSSLTVSNKDLSDMADEMVKTSEKCLQGARDRGTSNVEPLIHRVETAKAIQELVRKHAPGRQKTIFEQAKA